MNKFPDSLIQFIFYCFLVIKEMFINFSKKMNLIRRVKKLAPAGKK